VFVVATCNDATQLPPEFLRKGRFDEIFFVDLPSAGERARIFEAHIAARKRDPAAFDLGALAEASRGFSGAEIEQAVVAALHGAYARGGDLTTEEVLREIRATNPLSATRAEDVAALRAWARARAVPAGEGPEA
jgi:SpoVK/Ycf46/Vps4 family AAA+-type ATPase